MWYRNFSCIFFRFVTKHACDGQSDRQNYYDPQDRTSIAALRGKNWLPQPTLATDQQLLIRNNNFRYFIEQKGSHFGCKCPPRASSLVNCNALTPELIASLSVWFNRARSCCSRSFIQAGDRAWTRVQKKCMVDDTVTMNSNTEFVLQKGNA